MRNRLVALLKNLKNSPENASAESIGLFISEFSEWLRSFLNQGSSFFEVIRCRILILDGVETLSELSAQNAQLFAKFFLNISEAYSLLLLERNDPEIRKESWSSLLKIITSLMFHCEFVVWKDVMQSAFNFSNSTERLNIGSKGNFTPATFLLQCKSIISQFSMSDPITFYYWAQIYSAFLLPHFKSNLPDVNTAVEGTYYFVRALLKTYETDQFPNPLSKIPVINDGNVIHIFDTALATIFLNSFLFVDQHVNHPTDEIPQISIAIQRFLNESFLYDLIYTTEDPEIKNDIKFSLVNQNCVPFPDSPELLNTIIKNKPTLLYLLIDLCISLFQPLYNYVKISKDFKESLSYFSAHINITRFIISFTCTNIKSLDLLKYFSNKALKNTTERLIPTICNIIFSVLIEICSNDRNVYESIKNDLTDLMKRYAVNPILDTLLRRYSSFIGCALTVSLCNLQIKNPKSQTNVILNCVLFEMLNIWEGPQNSDWDSRFLYIPNSNISIEKAQSFVFAFFDSFCSLFSESLFIEFTKSFYKTLMYYEKEKYDAHFLCGPALDKLISLNSNTPELFTLAYKIIVHYNLEIKNITKLRFVSKLIKMINSNAFGYQDAYMIAADWVLSGRKYFLCLIEPLIINLENINVKNLDVQKAADICRLLVSICSILGTVEKPSNVSQNSEKLSNLKKISEKAPAKSVSFLASLVNNFRDSAIEGAIDSAILSIMLICAQSGHKLEDKSQSLNDIMLKWKPTQSSTMLMHTIAARHADEIDGLAVSFMITSLNLHFIENDLTPHQIVLAARASADFALSAFDINFDILLKSLQFFSVISDKKTAIEKTAEAIAAKMGIEDPRIKQKLIISTEAALNECENEYNFMLSNLSKQSGIVSVGKADTVLVRSDTTQLCISCEDNKIKLYGSSRQGSFCYEMDKNSDILIDALNSSKDQFYKAKLAPHLIHLAAGFSKRTQRVSLAVAVEASASFAFPMLESLGTRVAVSSLRPEMQKDASRSSFVYYRATNRIEFLFLETAAVQSRFMLSLGAKEAAKFGGVSISVGAPTHGFFPVAVSSSEETAPLTGRTILARRDLAGFVIETLAEAALASAHQEPSESFYQSWSPFVPGLEQYLN